MSALSGSRYEAMAVGNGKILILFGERKGDLLSLPLVFFTGRIHRNRDAIKTTRMDPLTLRCAYRCLSPLAICFLLCKNRYHDRQK